MFGSAGGTNPIANLLLVAMEAMMQSKTLRFAITVASSLFIAACGTTTGDRAASGGLLGAGTGAVIGSLAGGPATGAVIGGLAGATVGAVTSPCDLDLGTPFWKEHGGRLAYEKRCGHPP
jgi:hypothetical protein